MLLQGAYFLGKVLWAKGYTELLERLHEHSNATGHNVPVDVYGTGPDLQEVQQAACSSNLNLQFNGARDHADSSLQVRAEACLLCGVGCTLLHPGKHTCWSLMLAVLPAVHDGEVTLQVG
jgi:hypothetical protein